MNLCNQRNIGFLNCSVNFIVQPMTQITFYRHCSVNEKRCEVTGPQFVLTVILFS